MNDVDENPYMGERNLKNLSYRHHHQGHGRGLWCLLLGLRPFAYCCDGVYVVSESDSYVVLMAWGIGDYRQVFVPVEWFLQLWLQCFEFERE
jgi:hypothetical protein